MNAIYPGTFDPLTLGHEEIINRAANIFDRLIVAVAKDSSKLTMFDLGERLRFVETVVTSYPNVTCLPYDGLTTDFANTNNINVIVRGTRNSIDFNYESQIAQMNNTLDKRIETLLLVASGPYSSITSSLVRQVIELNGNYSKFVSKKVANAINPI